MQQRKYFGTDGIRGEVGKPPITPEFVLKLGWAVGRILAKGGESRVLIGKDTRISGYMFESALEAGLSAAGVDIQLLGPMPTPAIAYLTQTLHASAGIVISASHNPFFDNGIKIFSADGAKLPDEVELAIEAEMERPMQTVSSRDLGKAERVQDAGGRYIEFCKSTVPFRLSLKGMKVVVDCAHGASYHVAPNVFDELGAEVVPIGTEPDGFNINDGCGALHPEALQERVQREGADVGVALDGDGDRVLMVDHTGALVDGDELLFVIAEARRAEGQLNGAVVGTVMSNLGLEEALHSRGIALKRAKVGDRYVLELMRAGGWTLGGETSGHIICLDRLTTGDGIIAALQVLAALRRSKKSLHELKAGVVKHPQVLVNVRVPNGVDVSNHPAVERAVHSVTSQLNGQGRVLLRASGTEPLLRVMVEGRDSVQVKALADQLAGEVSRVLAAPG
ncbi:MAG: phosphoglucosamine mutase [Gammaproteobacteria bacterium]